MPGAVGRREREGGSFPNGALHVDLSAMGRDDLADDRQAEPCTTGPLCPGRTEEFIEDSRQEFLRDTLAGILDCKLDRALLGNSTQADLSPSRGVPQCVGDEIVENMLDSLLVYQDKG